MQAGGCAEQSDKDGDKSETVEPSSAGNEPKAVVQENKSTDSKDLTLPLAPEPNASEEDHSTDKTGTMSPKSFETFKGYLVHMPEMNLPWESMRSVRQCTCGVSFSYSVRKVNL